jgi:probable F420-dependent oxidoreductase
MPPFRFGVQLSRAASGRAWRDLARTIEGLGYSTLFIPDHFDDQWAPIAALTVAAEATERLKVGSLVFDNDYRHPVVLAKEVATLDLLSEGRVEFGLGAGWMTSDYEQSGITNDPPGTRIDRMMESLAIMKSLWTEHRTTLAGDHYTVTDALGMPTHQRPIPRSSSAAAASASSPTPDGRPTSSASTPTWPPAISAPRWLRPPWSSPTANGSGGCGPGPATGSTRSSCRY